MTDQRGGHEDSTAGRHFQDRCLYGYSYYPATTTHGMAYTVERQMVEPQTVPGFGYTVVSKNDLLTYKLEDTVGEDTVDETDRHRLVFDRERGGVVSWFDKQLGREWLEGGIAIGYNDDQSVT